MTRWTLSLAVPFLFAPPLLAQVDHVTLGTGSGVPGEVVEVPVTATFSLPTQSFFIGLEWDASRLELVGWSAEGTAAAGFNPLHRHFRTREPGVGFIGVQQAGRADQVFLMAPGEDVLVARVRLRVLAAAAAGAAAVLPVELSGPTRTTFAMRDAAGVLISGHPQAYRGGRVDVLPPRGPRPVGQLACEQFLDRVELTFTLTEAYDSLEVARGGTVVATLEGTATGHSDRPQALGLQTYTVTPYRAGEASYPADCQVILVSPAAPAVEELTCAEGVLRWRNPVLFDRIAVFRDGEQVAEIAGDADTWPDPEAPQDLTVYTVISELEGFRSPETNCLENALWVVEVGDVQVSPGETRFRVPIYLTNTASVKGLGLHLNIDQTRFRMVVDQEASLADTVSHPDTEAFLNGIGVFGVPAIGIIYDVLPPVEPEKYLAPGLRQRIVHFNFELAGEFQEGERFEARLESADFSSASNEPIAPDLLLAGEIRIGPGLPPVEGLGADVAGGGGGRSGGDGTGGGGGAVRLTWRNGAEYDTLRVERNGEPVGELRGDATDFVDVEVPGGTFTYKVTGLRGAARSFPATAFVSTVSPPGSFLRGDANRDGKVNITDPVRTLLYLFRGAAALPCEDAADSNDDGSINLTDAVFTLSYLFRGGVMIRSPGTRYPWYDPTPDGLTCRE